MGRRQNRNSRLNWLKQQQEMLKHLYENQEVKSWKKIESRMNSIFPDRKKTSKQYRQRYTNYIRFDERKAQRASWTKEQDHTIFTKYMQVGSKWVQISKFIERRSENQIKNRFYSTMRKLVRKINSVLSQNKHLHKIRKMIKQVSIFKLLQADLQKQDTKNQQSDQELERQSFIFKLKNNSLKLANKLGELIDDRQLLQLGMTRFENLRKSRKPQLGKRKGLPPIFTMGQKINQMILDSRKENNQQSNTDKISKSTQGEYKISQEENQGCSDISQLQKKIIKDNYIEKDLQYELSLILGIKYQPREFCFF